jgi:hypothetical protein
MRKRPQAIPVQDSPREWLQLVGGLALVLASLALVHGAIFSIPESDRKTVAPGEGEAGSRIAHDAGRAAVTNVADGLQLFGGLLAGW